MGAVGNDDASKVEKLDTADAEMAAVKAKIKEAVTLAEDVQVDLPVDIVDANGVTTSVTAKITVTPQVFSLLINGMVATLIRQTEVEAEMEAAAAADGAETPEAPGEEQ